MLAFHSLSKSSDSVCAIEKLLRCFMGSFFKPLMKIVVVCSLFFSALSNACMCNSEPKDILNIYTGAKGVYLVAINDIAVASNVDGRIELELGLYVLKSFKGKDVNFLKAVGYSHLPVLSKDGGLSKETTSCDMSYTFGHQYIVVVNVNEKIVISQCSENLLDIGRWGELVDLATDK